MTQYFSVSSLRKILSYFIKSRLMYGMFAFVDIKSRCKEILTKLLSHIKSILGLPRDTNNKRVLVTLGLSRIKCYLLIKLLSTVKKYILKFGEIQEKYTPTIISCIDKYKLPIGKNNLFNEIFKRKLEG